MHSELVRDFLDATYEASIAHQFARYARAVQFDDLPDDVVHQAKRCLLDTIGCGIGGYNAPGRVHCEELITELGGVEEATVFGSGIQTNARNAALINAFMVRYLDYNDKGGGGHQSDGIPGLLAVAEREGASGEELLTSIVVSYELGARFKDAIDRNGLLQKRGFSIDARGGLNMPPALGTLMGLSEEQIAHAIGCCASRNLPLKILDAHREEFTMTKNLRFGSVASDAIISCMLAQKGFTGPRRIVEGDSGISEVLLDDHIDLNTLLDFSGWRILDTRFKTLCINGTNHGNVWATVSLVEEHDLEPADVERVRLGVGERTYRHTANIWKKYPRNGETADHSPYFANAYAIKEREFGPDAFVEANFSDPVLLELIDKITVESDPEIPEWSHAGISEITTTDGEQYQEYVEEPPGVVTPMTDSELETKFTNMASEHVSDERVRDIIATVWNVEEVADVSTLLQKTAFD